MSSFDGDYDDSEGADYDYDPSYAKRLEGDDANFPNQEICDKIYECNALLKSAAEGQNATYMIEMLQDALVLDTNVVSFRLELTRIENVSNESLAKNPRRMGAHQLICQYCLHIFRDPRAKHDMEHISDRSIIHTFAASNALNDSEKYFHKKYATLLIHMVLFCVASARKSMFVMAIHPATAKVFREYAEFSKYDFDKWQNRHYGVNIDSLDPDKVMDECRLINASRYEADWEPGLSEYAQKQREELAPLTESRVEDLKQFADNKIKKLLAMMTKENSFYLSTPSNVYFI
jgi:hypothetical protein